MKRNDNGLRSRPFKIYGGIKELFDLSPDLPIGVGVGVNIDVDITRFDKLHQVSERFPHEVARQVFSRNGSLGQVTAEFTFLFRPGKEICHRRTALPLHAAVDVRSGQFLTHRAGFIDPGWGCGVDGEGTGKQLVCEVVPFRDLIMREGQALAKVRFERLTEPTDKPYDGNYTRQNTPRLSKHFVVPAEEATPAVVRV